MTNKKEELKGSTITMIPTGLSQRKELECFPNLKAINDPEYRPRETFTLVVDNIEVGYSCLEKYSSVSVNSHIFIKEEYRTPEVILALSSAFKRIMSEYMKVIGCTQLYTSCAGDDEGVKRIMESFGFDIEQHWIGTMNFNI